MPIYPHAPAFDLTGVCLRTGFISPKETTFKRVSDFVGRRVKSPE
jgi:hypothetical protein